MTKLREKEKICRKQANEQNPRQVRKGGVIEILWLIAFSLSSQGTVCV